MTGMLILMCYCMIVLSVLSQGHSMFFFYFPLLFYIDLSLIPAAAVHVNDSPFTKATRRRVGFVLQVSCCLFCVWSLGLRVYALCV